MAVASFIKFDSSSGIQGTSSLKGHEKEIQVLSWSHSSNQPTTAVQASTGGGTVEQAKHADFTLTKYIDTATTSILKACWSGRTIRAATFTWYRTEGDHEEKVLTIEFSDVIISNYGISGGSGDIPTETVSLSYGAIKYIYQTGAPNGVTQSVKHDLKILTVS